MEFENRGKLPEGVGKRIIEALQSNKSDEEEFQGFANYKGVQDYNAPEEPEYPEYKNYNYDYNSQNVPAYQEELSQPQAQPLRGEASESSNNIDILVDLVTKLPPGVTRQTGAQIIRHTMEAMGIPMNKVLANAQRAQEELEQNVKNNINVIEEYRSKIKNLDKEIQLFRKKAQDLEDIISLFILSENKK
jgi:hypothetical protein